MDALTIHQLQCFDAVVSEGGFQAGATKLHRSHSAVFTAIRNLESQLGRHSTRRDYYLVEGARTCTVSDQMMKKEMILHGMGWGHMPTFLIADELRDGRLLSIAGKHLRGGGGEIVAARRRDRPHGPVANRLWRFISQEASALRASIRKRD